MFTLGFHKTAGFDRHNDGSEFKISDTEPAPYVAGPGGMAPSGIPSYGPTGSKTPWAPEKSGKAAEKKRALDIATLGKMAQDARDGVGYGGSQSDIASTTASQLKYETTTDNISENQGFTGNKPKDTPYYKRLKGKLKGTEK